MKIYFRRAVSYQSFSKKQNKDGGQVARSEAYIQSYFVWWGFKCSCSKFDRHGLNASFLLRQGSDRNHSSLKQNIVGGISDMCSSKRDRNNTDICLVMAAATHENTTMWLADTLFFRGKYGTWRYVLQRFYFCLGSSNFNDRTLISPQRLAWILFLLIFHKKKKGGFTVVHKLLCLDFLVHTFTCKIIMFSRGVYFEVLLFTARAWNRFLAMISDSCCFLWGRNSV